MAQHYSSAAAFHRALLARLGSQAKTSGRTTEELQREYFTQRFLARVFSSPDSRWILTGGGGMLVRIPGARHSQDVDLLHPGTDIIGAVDELRALSVRPDLDRFTFEIEAKGSLTGVSRGAQLKATVYRTDPVGKKVLIRTDGAGRTHAFLQYLIVPFGVVDFGSD